MTNFWFSSVYYCLVNSGLLLVQKCPLLLRAHFTVHYDYGFAINPDARGTRRNILRCGYAEIMGTGCFFVQEILVCFNYCMIHDAHSSFFQAMHCVCLTTRTPTADLL